MLSFVLRRTLLRSGTLLSARRLLPCTVTPNLPLTWPVQRGFVTTSDDLNSGSTAGSDPKSKPKSTSRKTRSGEKVTHEDNTKGTDKPSTKKAKAEKKITIKPGDLPPKRPSATFVLWFTDWLQTQAKADSRLTAQNQTRLAAQTWHTVSEYEKQQYKEKYESLMTEYNRRMKEWREKIDPAVLHELNRRRIARGQRRIRGSSTGRPLTGYLRYHQEVRENTPQTQAGESHRDYFGAVSGRAGSQWAAMSEAEKAKYNDPAKAEFVAWRERRKAEGHTESLQEIKE
ncbi:hypothetical protein BJY52DRAFT_1271952 [Lactarius psammicola]|nr:hypothetical protein BJY52DRAFT_1271952 [Lactarius psammicola]